MRQIHYRFLGLCLLPILLTCLDDVLTFSGQSHDYWTGNYAQVNEVDPKLHQLMLYGPLLAIAREFAMILVFTGMILMMPQLLALTVSIAFSLGHFMGVETWLLYSGFRYGHEMACALSLVTAFAMAMGFRWGWRAEPKADVPIGMRLPFGIRWGIITLLSAVAIYMYLWPHAW